MKVRTWLISQKTMFGGFDAPMGETNYDDLHSHLEETVSLKQELEERLEEQKQTGEVDKKIVDQISDAEEEIDSVTNLLLEAEKQTYSDEPVHQMSLVNRENMDTKDDQDNNAHIEMARRLIDMIPSEQVPNPQENPLCFLGFNFKSTERCWENASHTSASRGNYYSLLSAHKRTGFDQ